MISFVYFDVGGVVAFDFSGTTKWYDLMDELGVPKTKQEAFLTLWRQYAEAVCSTMDIEDMRGIVEKSLGIKLAPNYSLLEGFVKRMEPNVSILPAIETAKQHGGIGLLTNMYKGMLPALQNKGALPDSAWNAVIDSFAVGVAKPDARIFDIAQKHAGIPAEQILFVDNTQENLDTPHSLGWQTFLYNPAQTPTSNQKLLAVLETT